ncbi:pentapeptide repeat-containing protein [Streptomyces sp. Lzd4kr]|nr:pentapeptide repeat-containing protein [Streptomyces sp. Lzd4kr]
MRLSPLRIQAERRGLRLWHVWIVLPLTFGTALAIAAGVFLAGWDLLGARELKPERRIDAKTLFDLVKLSFGVVAGAGALVALVVAYRRQRVDEHAALRDATRLHTERFTTAVSQLGNDSAAVRLGGVHAMAGLADDAPTRELRQTCIDVLCAYLRLPYTAESALPTNNEDARHDYLAVREVRHTVIRLIRDHLRMSPPHPRSWRGHDFDFTGVVFDGGDFSDVEFSGGRVAFHYAEFTGSGVDFSGTTFAGDVSFRGAKFAGGRVDFNGATFEGSQVSFVGAQFTDGVVAFALVNVTDGGISFVSAHFTGAVVAFDLRITGSRVLFNGAHFTAGRVRFYSTEFAQHAADFNGAAFDGGMVDLSQASGAAPDGLMHRSPLPDGLSLPSAWLPA